jgi:ribosome maturation factor RimP
MIDRKLIYGIIEKEIAGTDIFLVDVLVKPGGIIQVFIDSEAGVTIEDCARINRRIEKNLNRDETDFELQVSSPGLNRPFKVIKQYLKNVGNNIELVLTDGLKQNAKILNVNDDGIEVEFITAAGKVKITEPDISRINKNKMINYKNIKSAKAILSF